MKAYLINMHLLVPRSRSPAKVKVKYKGYISQKNGRFGGIHVSQTHLASGSLRFESHQDFIFLPCICFFVTDFVGVFKRLILHICKHQGLFCKELKKKCLLLSESNVV